MLGKPAASPARALAVDKGGVRHATRSRIVPEALREVARRQGQKERIDVCVPGEGTSTPSSRLRSGGGGVDTIVGKSGTALPTRTSRRDFQRQSPRGTRARRPADSGRPVRPPESRASTAARVSAQRGAAQRPSVGSTINRRYRAETASRASVSPCVPDHPHFGGGQSVMRVAQEPVEEGLACTSGDRGEDPPPGRLCRLGDSRLAPFFLRSHL